jgi:hypothetical protein
MTQKRCAILFQIGEHFPERDALGCCAAATASRFGEGVQQQGQQETGKPDRKKHDLPGTNVTD